MVLLFAEYEMLEFHSDLLDDVAGKFRSLMVEELESLKSVASIGPVGLLRKVLSILPQVCLLSLRNGPEKSRC